MQEAARSIVGPNDAQGLSFSTTSTGSGLEGTEGEVRNPGGAIVAWEERNAE